ncbi:MAG: hypothetical protein ACP5MI_00020 [Candidatus Kryptoniota bacterium]
MQPIAVIGGIIVQRKRSLIDIEDARKQVAEYIKYYEFYPDILEYGPFRHKIK